jgi:hypothetical protein
VDFETGPILAAHRGVAPFAAACLTLARMLAADLQRAHAVAATVAGDEHDFLRLPGVRRVASAMVAAASPAQGFLNPVRPAPWLVGRVRAECDALLVELGGYLMNGLETLPEYDLNTGTRLSPAMGAWVA